MFFASSTAFRSVVYGRCTTTNVHFGSVAGPADIICEGVHFSRELKDETEDVEE